MCGDLGRKSELYWVKSRCLVVLKQLKKTLYQQKTKIERQIFGVSWPGQNSFYEVSRSGWNSFYVHF